MPTYEYECSACGHRFEEFQSIKAKPTVVCPKCKKRKVKRLISAGAGFIFKGSGFYETDYRSEGYKAEAKADSAPATTEKASTDKKDAAAPAKSEPAKGGEAPVVAPAAKPATTGKSESKGSGKKK
jgi:putative FmdB family regulatory protein